ncbi:MAG: hypothetical protein JNM00_07425 [Flavobacteriales bacterium]|nr:hypothetical protein [Flavobacteriales bacterium]
MRLFIGTITWFFSVIAMAQDIKPLDFAPVFRKNKVEKQWIKEVTYRQGAAPDTLLLGEVVVDPTGRMSQFTEYFAGGRVFAIYRYHYDEKGSMTGCTVAHTFLQFEEIPFLIEREPTGRIKSRTTAANIPGFWIKETYTYNNMGVLIRSERWNESNGQLSSAGNSSYPAFIARDEKSLSTLFDNRGLPILQKMKGGGGEEISILYQYDFY